MNISGVQEEFADVLSYLMNIALILDMDGNKIQEIFLEKFDINMKRKRQGY